MYTRSRADIDDIIRRAHCVLVVLNDYERVAYISELTKRIQKLLVVALVQSYARLVENI